MIDLRALAAAAGGEVRGPNALIPGPGHSKRDRSLSISVGDRGQLVWHSFAGDMWPAVSSYLRSLGVDTGYRLKPSAEDEAKRESIREANENDRLRKQAIARDLWRTARRAAGTPAETYLKGRGLAIPEGAMIRFHERTPFKPYSPGAETYPAMIAAVTDEAGKVVGAHVTYLAADGSRKADVDPSRKVVGTQKGGMIRLGAVAEFMVVAEGIESALSAGAAAGVPALAAISSGNFGAITLPAGVRAILVAFDRDPNSAGEKGARQCVRRALDAGIDAMLLPPPASFGDWNDPLRATQ